ncbi:MAG: DUF4270 family protein [Rikenellaceae bacterium]
MNRSNLLRRLIGGISVVAIVAIITFSGCTNVDNTLGNNLTLDEQSLKLGQLSFGGFDGNFFESRLYKTDSIKSSGLSYGYFGAMGNDTFGTRSAAFFSQYVPGNALEDDIFGYMPIFDSAVLYITIEGYSGDTSIKQQFEVFEITDNSFITESADSVFFPNLDLSDYIADQPVFTFTFPDADNGIYVSTTYIKMDETPYTTAFMDRLMLITETDEYDEDIYTDEEEWVNEFKGLYIRPVAALEPITSGTPGAIFSTTLETSGFGFYGRNREEVDHTLIQDTIGMTYYFYSSYAEYGNIAASMFEHNYDGSLINLDDVKTPETTGDVPLTSTLRVEGMAGIVSEITLTKEFFDLLDTILETEEAENGEIFESLFFNQAKLKIYMYGVDGYDPADINPFTVTPWMNVMPTSLGLYTNYADYYYEEDDVTYTMLAGVADYLYAYESSYTLDFGGSMNRSWGCYVMNISSQIQSVWNNYLIAKEEAEEDGTEIDYDDISGCKVYLAPIASNLFTYRYASLQAGDATENSAPIYLDLTYTMIR